jgi:hypothetical protein
VEKVASVLREGRESRLLWRFRVGDFPARCHLGPQRERVWALSAFRDVAVDVF